MTDRDYVLGTHDAEIARLRLQHAVWRPRALDAWRRAGFRPGQRIVDFGSGPGYAALDLAEVVGSAGEVIALERSTRFLDALRGAAAARGLRNVTAVEVDLALDLPVKDADGAWCRWIFAFLPNPREALERLLASLKPGGVVVIHEYLDYATWRMAPRVPSFEAFVAAVMSSWRAEGGEPDIGLAIPALLASAGCRVEAINPIVDVVGPQDFIWAWPQGFFETGLARLADLGRVAADDAELMRRDYALALAHPAVRMMTPLVGEIIARKP